jgi:DNA invertase Pin-like site-specific DNA recombinase
MIKVRCAIYTRKSSDEGLDKQFNSLDAQREACEAFIKSQKHAGWTAVSDLYDDGGLSGGTMERAALQRLLADIKAGKVQIVVVYKVDRLTRSLADFAKIVDIFDERGASFVSVTQQFNTTTSMGRLTLNMLLSFAQFEREIAGERIRDKIAASKAKGMWMGGTVPLGYDVKDRKLIVNPAEAETVRLIFQRYTELGSVKLLQAELDRRGLRSKRRDGAKGLITGRPSSRAESCIWSFRTASTEVKLLTRATSIPANTNRSLTLNSGLWFRRSWPRTERLDPLWQELKSQVSCQGCFLTMTATG